MFSSNNPKAFCPQCSGMGVEMVVSEALLIPDAEKTLRDGAILFFKGARQRLGFSQEYVANCLGIGRSAITQIELGNRKITSDEIQKFCQLYHVSADYLLNQEFVQWPAQR